MDPLERITVELGGSSFSGWSDVSISLGVDRAVRTAELTISDFSGARPFLPGDECTLSAGGDVLITGYVRDVEPSYDSNQHQVRLTIVSRTVDATEASINHLTGFTKDKDLIEIAREFDTAGIGIVADESFPKEPRSFVFTGSTLFHHIERLARAYGALIYDTPEGKLRIAKKPRGRHSGALKEGGNIISATGMLTERGRHSPVIVRGQSSRGTGPGALRSEGRAIDRNLRRERPLVLILESQATSEKLIERAKRQVRRAAGVSTRANVVVSGWRDAGGTIFEPHYLIRLASPRIYCDQDMAIQSVTLTQSIAAGGAGTRAILDLVDPSALNGEPGGGQGSGGEGVDWSVDPETTIGATK